LRSKLFVDIDNHWYEYNNKKYLLLGKLISRLAIFRKYGKTTTLLAQFLREHDIPVATLSDKHGKKTYGVLSEDIDLLEELHKELKVIEQGETSIDYKNLDELEPPEKEIVMLSLTGTPIIDISRVLNIDIPTVTSIIDKYSTIINKQYLPHVRNILSEMKRSVG
jgi:hypothetical protein